MLAVEPYWGLTDREMDGCIERVGAVLSCLQTGQRRQSITHDELLELAGHALADAPSWFADDTVDALEE